MTNTDSGFVNVVRLVILCVVALTSVAGALASDMVKADAGGFRLMETAVRIMYVASDSNGKMMWRDAYVAGASADMASDSCKMLLPRDNEFAGWKKDGAVERYGRDNLWKYNDGAADEFIEYGFIELFVQNYISRKGTSLKVEIYRHSSPAEAFGIFSKYRDPGGHYYDIGAECFADSYSLHFWKACYYVHIGVYQNGSTLAQAMIRFARAIDSRIRGDSRLPVESTLFPPEGLVTHSLSYTPHGALGLEWFPPAFSAAYTLDSTVCNLYIASFKNPFSAAHAMERLGETAGVARCAFSPPRGAECMEWKQRSGKFVYIARFGKRIAAVEGITCHAKGVERLFSVVSKRILSH